MFNFWTYLPLLYSNFLQQGTQTICNRDRIGPKMFLTNACLKSNGWQEKSSTTKNQLQNTRIWNNIEKKPSFPPDLHEGYSNVWMAPDLWIGRQVLFDCPGGGGTISVCNKQYGQNELEPPKFTIKLNWNISKFTIKLLILYISDQEISMWVDLYSARFSFFSFVLLSFLFLPTWLKVWSTEAAELQKAILDVLNHCRTVVSSQFQRWRNRWDSEVEDPTKNLIVSRFLTSCFSTRPEIKYKLLQHRFCSQDKQFLFVKSRILSSNSQIDGVNKQKITLSFSRSLPVLISRACRNMGI